MSYSRKTLEVQGSPMETLVFEPQGSGPHPAILVAQHLPIAHAGLEKDPFTLDIGDRLAKAGYVAAIPFMFHWWPPEQDIEIKRKEWRDDWTLADLDATWGLLAGMPNVDSGRLGVIGHCWGGRVSWLAACHKPDLKACAVLYGGRIKLAMGPPGTPPIELAGRIGCPMIGIFGNDDQNPSPADVNDLDAALDAAGVAHEFHRYEGAGHGFQDFGDRNRYHPEATADAWDKVLGFFARTLK